MNIVSKILHQMAVLSPLGKVSKPQCKFMHTLLCTLLIVRGKVNFTNLSRYCALSERTLRRQFRQPFDWLTFNWLLVARVVPSTATQVFALDASFVAKSGKKTYGVDWFFNGCANRPEKGLEVSLLSLIDVEANTGYALSVRQTPSRPPATREAQAAPGAKNATQTRRKPAPAASTETRMDFYLQHLQETQGVLPEEVRYGVFDGAFAKKKFVDGVYALQRHVVSKLRCDANLRYVYTGPQKKRGARRKYDGKVDFNDLRRWQALGEVEPQLQLYTVVAHHMTLQRVLRVVLLLNCQTPNKPRYVLLFCTDVDVPGLDIYRFYKARFQIEFLFRDAKQWMGLQDCQARDEAALHFHFNAAMSAVNVVKIQAWHQHQQVKQSDPFVFSLASWKQRSFNEHLLEIFISNLGLEPSWIKKHPRYEYLRNYGAIVA